MEGCTGRITRRACRHQRVFICVCIELCPVPCCVGDVFVRVVVRCLVAVGRSLDCESESACVSKITKVSGSAEPRDSTPCATQRGSMFVG